MSNRYYKRNRHGGAAPHEQADDEDSDIDFEDLDLEDFRSMSGGGRNGRRESTRSSRGRNRKSSTQSSFDFEDEEIGGGRGKTNRSNSRGASLARSINNEWITTTKRNEMAKKERDLIRNDPRMSEKRDSFDSPLSVSESDRERKKKNKSTVNGSVAQQLDEAKLVKEIIEETKKILVKDKVKKTAAKAEEKETKQVIKEVPTKVIIKPEVKKKEPSPAKEELVEVEVEVVEEIVSESEEEDEEEEVEEEESEEEEEEEEEVIIQVQPKKQPTPEPVKQPSPIVEEIEEDSLGPPPEAPTHEWECEHCTFVNEANTKICTICCKTISAQASVKLIIQNPETPSPSPPRPTETPLKGKGQIVPVNGKSTPSTSSVSSLSSKASASPRPETVKISPATEPPPPKKVIVSSMKSSKSDATDPKKGRTRKISFWPGLTINKSTTH